MFGRRRSSAPTQAGRPATGYHTQTAVVGDTDAPANARVARLFFENNLGMQGHSGDVVGYDRGDPAHTLSADLALVHPGQYVRNPINANARLGLADQVLFSATPDYGEVASVDPAQITDPNNGSYRQLLWQRLER